MSRQARHFPVSYIIGAAILIMLLRREIGSLDGQRRLLRLVFN